MKLLDAYYKAIQEYREAKHAIVDHYVLADIYDSIFYDIEGSQLCIDTEDVEELKSEIARIRINTKAILKAKELIDSIELKFG